MKESIDILIIDDDVALATQLKWFLPKKYITLLAHTAEDGLKVFRERRPNIVILDLGLPPNENTPDIGLKLQKEIVAEDARTKVIVLTGQKGRGAAIEAIKNGAFDYLMKPVGDKELKASLKRAEFFTDIEKDVPEEESPAKITPHNLEEGFETLKEDMKRHIIEEALNKTDNNISATARLLGLRRTSVYYYLNKYNIRTRD